MVMWGPKKKLDRIGSAVLTFIGYKPTNKHNTGNDLKIKKVFFTANLIFAEYESFVKYE